MLTSQPDLAITLSDGLSSLHSTGWVAFGPESRQLPTLSLARALGEPIQSPSGELVRELVPKAPADANFGTFSYAYGKASFPLHTDTAFWPLPARYLVMRVTGDTRRPTLIAPIPLPLSAATASNVQSSIWVVNGARPFYCSMQFRHHGNLGFRYDPMLMQPANESAAKVQPILSVLLAGLPCFALDWAAVGTVIVDNWRTLHGRGPEPLLEGKRVLERVYVR